MSGYFHTENASTHATDASPETPLVAASRNAAPAAADEFDEMTNAELKDELKRRGEPIPHSPSKANLIAALRGE